ncbi:MAG: hypothetical protein MN733_04470, partial [Nitrososphaera sp.]|nr:hypothetical protein [Nitrososphaera sp.]
MWVRHSLASLRLFTEKHAAEIPARGFVAREGILNTSYSLRYQPLLVNFPNFAQLNIATTQSNLPWTVHP